MNATMGDALLLGVEKISNVISDLAPEVWRIMIRQQYAEVGAMAFVILWCVAYFIFAYKVRPFVDKKVEEESSYDVGWTATQVFLWVGVAIAILIIAILGCSIILHLVNPEYYALKALLYMLP